MRVLRIWAAVAFLIPMAAAAAITGDDLYLVSVGRGPGANDSAWYTTVWIHNPENESQLVTVSLMRRGQANTAPEQQSLVVNPGETVTIGDVLWDLFGEDEVSGALRFEAGGRVVVSSRIFNLPGSDPADSQGQFMAGMPGDLAVGAGAPADIPGITQPHDDSFRCNFAVVETSGLPVDVEVTLYDGGGADLASRTYALRPYEPMQRNLSHLGGSVAVDGGRLRAQVTGGEGRILALASMVGNGVVSQDPSTLEMAVDLPDASSTGDISAVIAGDGLAGGGTSGDVTLHIDTAGAAAGQSLVFDGAEVVWESHSGGLTLPFAGSQATTGAVLKITNTSASGNVFGLRGENASTSGAGVYGWSTANSGLTGGVIGQSSSPSGSGVFGITDSHSGFAVGVIGSSLSPEGAGVAALGAADGVDLIVGGNGNADEADNGVIAADPRFVSSDLHLTSNDDVRIVLDADGSGEDVTLEVVSSEQSLFTIEGDGDLRQPETAAGLLKAAAIVWCGEEPEVIRQFNSVTGTVTARGRGVQGSCHVDFGFDLSDSFIIEGTEMSSGPGGIRAAMCEPRDSQSDMVTCWVRTLDGTWVDGPIHVLVF